MHILNKSIGCQSGPLSIIALLHLHAIVFPFSCGSYLGLSFDPGGVVESPKNLTCYQSSHGVKTSSQEVQPLLDLLLVQHWQFGHHNLEEIQETYFVTFYCKQKLELASANQRLVSYRRGPKTPKSNFVSSKLDI